MTNKKTSIILLSGGLDSFVALDIIKKQYEVKLALTFDYGQTALKDELIASREIAKKYNIEHKIIKLPFLKEIAIDTHKNFWIPNRNGLFLNIGGVYCDKFKYDGIIFGANIEEAKTFVDNSEDFIKNIQKSLKYSTQTKPKILTPLIKMTKYETILYAIENNLDFSLIKSCYNSKEITGHKHCGSCPSCLLIKKAIKDAKRDDLLKVLDFSL